MIELKRLEVPISGMDCAECAESVQRAIAALPGVQSADVLLASEKAIIQLDPARVSMTSIRAAVASAGEYAVPDSAAVQPAFQPIGDFNRQLTLLLGGLFAFVLLVVIAGEWLGWLAVLNKLVPFPIGVALAVLGGWPIYRSVIKAALRRQVISHTLMTLGVFAALAVGEWVTAALVVVFMRVGAYVEAFTTESARRAVKSLTALAPQTARVERGGAEVEIPISEVAVGETVIVRPGEKIPVDGEVVAGHATVNQAAITGEAMPVEAAQGSHVFAATIATLGSLRVKTLQVGADSMFGRVVKLVEEAESNRANVQRFADRFSAVYLPVVAGIAALTLLISRNPLSAAAVLVVACSCSIALATPVAVLASIGSAAKRGLLIKGGKYLEVLAKADVVLVDKTGTLTLGQPQITDIVPLNGMSQSSALALAASAERYSEHPLAEAVRAAARSQNLSLSEPEEFETIPGAGVRATINGRRIAVGNRALLPEAARMPAAATLEAQGKTLLFLAQDGQLEAAFAAADTLRPEVPAAIAELRALGIGCIELLTGDNERAAAALAEQLGIAYRANLLPDDKIAIVKDYQSRGHRVVMVGDGVNDAPALAQADIGIAMGAAGSAIAVEAAHIALMRDDWALLPDVVRVARRTMSTIKMNLAFTAVYNVVGLTLAALGILPPALAAAAQSLPDVGILANSARLLRQK